MYWDFTKREEFYLEKEYEKIAERYSQLHSCAGNVCRYLYLRLSKLNKLEFLDDIEKCVKESLEGQSSIPLVDKWLDNKLAVIDFKNNCHFIAHILWDCLTDVPIDEKECIETDWLDFPKGTHREEIWHWFEKEFEISIHDLFEEHDELMLLNDSTNKEQIEREGHDI